MLTGAEIIVESFFEHAIERLYVYPGGTIAPILDAAVARGMPIITPRNEQGAGYAALAAAKITGLPQVVMVTSGPGVTNLVTVVADAYFDSVPLVVITGQVGLADMRGNRPVRQRGFQEVDTCAILKPVSKAQFLVKDTAELPDILSTAFSIAASGRPGPVVVDLPMPVQRASVPDLPSSLFTPADAVTLPVEQDILKVVQWLRVAKRPVIIAGQGVLMSGAQNELRQFSERAGIPVSQSLMALGAFPTNSPLALGFHGHTGNQYAGMAIHNADLVLVFGSRLDIRQTGSQVSDFVPNGRIVRVDLDATEITHSRVRSDLSIEADVRATLVLLNTKFNDIEFGGFFHWREQIDQWRLQFPLQYLATGTLKPQYVIEVANRLAQREKVICVSGVGSHQQWAARHFDFDYPSRRWLTSGGHGTMGFDLPVAMGAQIVRPDALVICIVGDGSLQMNIQELATIVELALPVKIIVINNHRLGIVSQFQQLNWQSDPTCGKKWNPDFAAIALAYGIKGYAIRNWSEVESVLGQAFDYPGPVLINCIVDDEENVSPMLMGGKRMDQMWPYCT
jgi:acetolactate synthase-1/2/3 large subunit